MEKTNRTSVGGGSRVTSSGWMRVRVCGARAAVIAGPAPCQQGESALGLASSGFFGRGAAQVAPDGRMKAFDLAGFLGVQPARLSILALDGFVHFLAMDGNLDRGRDPQSNLIAPNIHHGDDDVIADDDTFVAVSGQDQHRSRLLPPANEARDHPRSVALALGRYDGAEIVNCQK
jgi:hypothetical protein